MPRRDAGPRRARRDPLPLPPLARVNGLLDRRRAPRGGHRRGRARRRADAGRDRGRRPGPRPADADRAARAGDRHPRACGHRRGARRRRARPRARARPAGSRRSSRSPAWATRAEDAEAPDAGARAVEAFRQLVTTLRLFKPGGVGLGPHAWARAGGDRWRRIATGEARPRPGGYVLAPEELADLMALSRALAQRSTPFGRPARDRGGLAGALARVDLPLRGRPRARTPCSRRSTTTCFRSASSSTAPARPTSGSRCGSRRSAPSPRAATRRRPCSTALWRSSASSGRASRRPVGGGAIGPIETAARIEELTRAILKDAACGHLGTDLRATADEILLADGFAVGDGLRGAARGDRRVDVRRARRARARLGRRGRGARQPTRSYPEEEPEDRALFEPIEFRAEDEVEYAVDEKVSEPEGRITVHQPAFDRTGGGEGDGIADSDRL